MCAVMHFITLKIHVSEKWPIAYKVQHIQYIEPSGILSSVIPQHLHLSQHSCFHQPV